MRRARVAAWFVILVAGSVQHIAAQATPSPETQDKIDAFVREREACEESRRTLVHRVDVGSVHAFTARCSTPCVAVPVETSRKPRDDSGSARGVEVLLPGGTETRRCLRSISATLKSLDALKMKLLQFPKGAELEFAVAPARNDELKSEQIFQQIKKYLEENGMTLKRAPTPAPENNRACAW